MIFYKKLSLIGKYEDNLVLLNIVSSPHTKEKHQKELYQTFKRQLELLDNQERGASDAPLDRSGVTMLKEKLRGNSRLILAK